MLCEQRPSSQFKGVSSSWVSRLQPTHCSHCTEVRLFQTVPREHKKVIMLFVIRDLDSDHSEKKGHISGIAGRATSAVKIALLLQVTVNITFLIL